jgi:hypothetical protein
MTMPRWNPPEELSAREKFVLKRCKKKRKLFAFLREHRHELFSESFQDELESMYRDTGAGKAPVPPALMAMALILQGYLGVSDADAVELTVVDLRWQMVLECLGAETPAFSQGALFAFRERLIASDMDRRLLEHTARIARSSKGFDGSKLPKTLRVAVDSSPLAGAGRVEDTINLIAHAARKVVECVADLLELEFADVCKRAGIPLLMETSVKKALDRDWSDAEQKAEAIEHLAREVLSLERWLDKNLADQLGKPPLAQLLEVVDKLVTQDLEPDPDGSGVRITDGVAEDRQISVEDPEMRHGRKSKSKRIDGYKRHIARDLDRDAIVACAVTPANQPENEALPMLKDDIGVQGLTIKEAHFDRAYISSPSVLEIQAEGGAIICKPWKSRNGDLFAKDDFKLDLRSKTITCPGEVTVSITLGRPAEFPAARCDSCAIRGSCTTSRLGNSRTVSIALNEPLQQRLRKLAKTKSGRAVFRERVPVEHSLAHIGQRQGSRARYCGIRKNTYDLRRAAIIQNLEISQRKAS